jgi:hypothetical protein
MNGTTANIKHSGGDDTPWLYKDLNSTPKTQELDYIIQNETLHFPLKRTIHFVVTLLMLFLTSMCLGTKYSTRSTVDPVYAYLMFFAFILYTIYSTI